ncbi:MAG TPA: hypothetical protein ENF55_03735 [Thermoprotei archaeon]|nr:hypothetical protein [Thermoprotei archaeon]
MSDSRRDTVVLLSKILGWVSEDSILYFLIVERGEPVFWYGNTNGFRITAEVRKILEKKSVTRVIVEKGEIVVIGSKDSNNRQIILVAEKENAFLLFQLFKKAVESNKSLN